MTEDSENCQVFKPQWNVHRKEFHQTNLEKAETEKHNVHSCTAHLDNPIMFSVVFWGECQK